MPILSPIQSMASWSKEKEATLYPDHRRGDAGLGECVIRIRPATAIVLGQSYVVART